MPITSFDLDQSAAGNDAQATYPEQQADFTPLQQASLVTDGGAAFRIDQMTVQIAGATASESLALNATALAAFAGIWSYDATTGTLTVSANDLDDADWTTILNNVIYANTSDDPEPTRTLTVTAIDSDGFQEYYDSLGFIPQIAAPLIYDLTGGAGNDFAQGGAGNQSIASGDGGDTVNGDTDTPSADDGNDLLNGGDGNDHLNGGGGDDRIIGGLGNEDIRGDYDDASGYDGDDLIDAGDGADTAVGGNGDDTMAGGVGNDLLIGDFRTESAGGNDRLNGGANSDQLFGGAADDIVVGGVGGDQLFGDYRAASGSDGNDIMAGGAGDDRIDGGGGSGDVVVFLGTRSEYEVVQNTDGSFTVTDTVADRDGVDTVEAVETFLFADGYIPAPDVVTSTGGGGFGMQQASADLTITVTPVNDAPDAIAFTGAIAEDATAGTVVETAIGHDPDGDDQVLTYALLDDAGGLFAIDADTGEVTVAGALDFETASSHTIGIEITDAAGEIFSDRFRITVTDVIDNPELVLTPDPDEYDVSDSADHFTLYALESDDVVSTGSGDDKIDGGAGRDTLAGGGGNDRLFGRADEDRLFGLDGNDTLRGDYGDDVLFGSGGDDRVTGCDGDDILQAGTGNDVLIGNGGRDTMVGGTGNDIYVVQDAGDDVIEAVDGGADTVRAGIDYRLAENVEAMFMAGAARAGTGNALNNGIFGSGGGDTLSGLAGDDVLRGRGGRDVLVGGDGADRMNGGVGKDTFTGGAGRDLFQFLDGDMGATAALADVITDFSQADDDDILLGLIDADVNAGGNQAFAFLGTGAFTGTAGELRYDLAAGNTVISADTDGDATADWYIGLAGAVDLTTADFVL